MAYGTSRRVFPTPEEKARAAFDAWSAHRVECPSCKSFQFRASDLGRLCLEGSRRFKTAYADIEVARRVKPGARVGRLLERSE